MSTYKLVCPHCMGRMRIRTSEGTHIFLRVAYLQCVNEACGWSVRAQFEMTHEMSPSGMANLIPPRRPSNRKHSTEVGEIVTGRLRLDGPTLLAHAPQRILHQLLTVDLLVVESSQVRLTDRLERRQFGFAQWADLFHFDQVTVDHFFDRCALAVRPFDSARLVQFGLPLSNPGLGGLFSGKGLTLLVNLRPIAKQAYLCRVTDAAVGAFPCSDRGHGQLVQL